jgi:hypothetical protein
MKGTESAGLNRHTVGGCKSPTGKEKRLRGVCASRPFREGAEVRFSRLQGKDISPRNDGRHFGERKEQSDRASPDRESAQAIL